MYIIDDFKKDKWALLIGSIALLTELPQKLTVPVKHLNSIIGGVAHENLIPGNGDADRVVEFTNAIPSVPPSTNKPVFRFL